SDRRSHAADAGARASGPSGGCAVHRGRAEQVRCGGRSRTAGPGGTRSTRVAEEVSVSRGKGTGDPAICLGCIERGSQVGSAERRADEGRGRVRSAAAALTGKPVPDAYRRHLPDLTPG